MGTEDDEECGLLVRFRRERCDRMLVRRGTENPGDIWGTW